MMTTANISEAPGIERVTVNSYNNLVLWLVYPQQVISLFLMHNTPVVLHTLITTQEESAMVQNLTCAVQHDLSSAQQS